MRIGIFGGAFNPVHNGHLNLAKGFKDILSLDKIIFIPTSVPPHKSSVGLAPQCDRFNMLALAVESEDSFEVSDIEFKRQGKSYTVDTIKELKEIYNNDTFFLIIGADQFLTFHKWYKYKEILDMVTICTSAREDENERVRMLDYADNLDGLDMNRFFLSPYPVMKLSSSMVREKIKNGEDVSSLVPAKVLDYIIEKGLYSV